MISFLFQKKLIFIGSVRTITFHNEEHCLFSGSHDSLKVHCWEPYQNKDTVLMGWGKIKDIAIASTQLVSNSF